MSGSGRIRRAAVPLALAVATLVVHAPRQADFAYDDNEFVVANQSIRSLGGALAALALPFPPEQPERGLYRPLVNLSYALDHALWDGRALGFQATNLALYLVVVLLVWRLSWVYMQSEGFAAATALLFAVHPLHCEAVDSVAGRSEVLALLFSLLALLACERALRGARAASGWILASALAYALACASKETGVVLPAILAVQVLSHAPPGRRAGLRAWLVALRPLAPHVLVLLAYLLLRGAVLGRFAPATALLSGQGLEARIATIGTVYLANLVLLVWPALEVDFFYQAWIGLPLRVTAVALLGWAALLASAAGAIRLAWLHFGGHGAPGADAFRSRATALCAAAIFAATLLPTSHLFDIGALLAERFLFAPSLGFLLLAVLGGRRLLRAGAPWLRPQLAGALVVGALAVVGAWRSHARAREWRDPVLLWRAAERSLPADVRVPTNLAAALIDRGDLEAARDALARALAIDPDYRPALGNRATLLLEEGRLDEAAATYQRMLDIDDEDFLTWYNLGRVELQRGRRQLAAQHFRRSLELNPNYSYARLGLESLGQLDGPQRSR